MYTEYLHLHTVWSVSYLTWKLHICPRTKMFILALKRLTKKKCTTLFWCWHKKQKLNKLRTFIPFFTVAAVHFFVADSMAVAAVVWTHRNITCITQIIRIACAHTINAHTFAWTADIRKPAWAGIQSEKKYINGGCSGSPNKLKLPWVRTWTTNLYEFNRWDVNTS